MVPYRKILPRSCDRIDCRMVWRADCLIVDTDKTLVLNVSLAGPEGSEIRLGVCRVS
jgi:hypothetical protein